MDFTQYRAGARITCITLMLGSLSGCDLFNNDDDDKAIAPEAAFTVNLTRATAPATFTFTDMSENGSEDIHQWLWEFGNGASSSEQHPQYEYAIPGTYSVSLTVTSEDGVDTVTRSNLIEVEAQPPVAAFSVSSTTGDAPLTVTFSDESTQGTGTINQWTWDFGDGNTSTESSPEHTYTEPGEFTVSLTVSDEYSSHSTAATEPVVVTEAPPSELTLIDSPVNGIRYECGENTGVTEQGGKLYCYEAPVTFSIGSMPIGTLTEFPEDLDVYLQDLLGVSRSEYSDASVVKLGRLLQSLDDDGLIAEAIDIPAETAAKFSAGNSLDDDLNALAEIAGVTLVSEPFAIAHLKRSYEGGDDASYYQITIFVDDADPDTLLIPTPVELTLIGAEILNSDGEAINSLLLSDTRKVAQVFLRNPPQDGQVLKVLAKSEGYVDNGTSTDLSPPNGSFSLGIKLLKDKAGEVTNGVTVFKEEVTDKVASGSVAEAISYSSSQNIGQPGVRIDIPAGVKMTDASGNPVNAAELSLITYDLNQFDAQAALPNFTNGFANPDDMLNDGLTVDSDNPTAFPLSYTTINIVDGDGNKVKQFSEDIEITMQLAVGTTNAEGAVIVPGDEVPVFSYDESSGALKYEKLATIEDINPSDGLYDMRVQTNHLTGYGYYDNKQNFCSDKMTTLHFKDIDSGDFVKMWSLTKSINDYGGVGYWVNYSDIHYIIHLEMNWQGHVYLWDGPGLPGLPYHSDYSSGPQLTKESSLWLTLGGSNIVYTYKVYNLGGKLVGSKTLNNICDGQAHDVLVDTTDVYDYEEAREVLDDLAAGSLAIKQEGIANHVSALRSVKNLSASLSLINDDRGDELLNDSIEVIRDYTKAFLEKFPDELAALSGQSINDSGCMSSIMESYKEELDQNITAYLAVGGEEYSLAEFLTPLMEQVAQEYVDFEPLYITFVDDSLTEYIACGMQIVASLNAVGYAPTGVNLIAEIESGYDYAVMSNVAAIRAIVDEELNTNGLVGADTAAIYENILTQADAIGQQLIVLNQFSNASVTEIETQIAYLEWLKASGLVGTFTA